MLAVRIDDPVEEEAQEHAQPDEAGDDWEYLNMIKKNEWLELWLIGEIENELLFWYATYPV